MSTTSGQQTMRAWQLDKFGDAIQETLFLNNTAARPRTSLLPDEILVHVISSSINPIDYKIAEMSASRFTISTPSSPGLDYCGRVVSTGNAIDSLRNGQLVFGRLEKPQQFGTLGEFVIATLPGCVSLPSGVDIDHAAAIGTAGLTAYQCLQPYVGLGNQVFINGGSGGVGSFAIQIAKALDFKVTTSCSTANVALCKELGADEVIDYKVIDVTEKLKSSGVLYDLVVDNVGTPANLYVESTNFLKESGIFVQVAASMTMASAGSVLSRMLKPHFMGGGKRKYKFVTVTNNSEAFSQIAEVW